MKKALKILSVILIVLAVLTIILSVVALAGGSLLSGAGVDALINKTEEETTAATIAGLGVVSIFAGVLMLILGIFDLITGIFGVRGAGGNRVCAGRAKVMGVVSLIVAIVMNVSLLWGSVTVSSVLGAILSLAVQCLFIYVAYRVQREQETLNQ